MNGLPYYQRYPRDFLEGTIGLDLETKGAYAILLDLIYLAGLKGLVDQPQYIAGQLGCSVRKWNQIRSRLIKHGKIRCDRGMISNARADFLLEKTRKYQDRQAENGRGSIKNKDLEKPSPPPLSESDNRKKDIPPPSVEGRAREAPPDDGRGGDFHSDLDEVDPLLGEVREASGVRVVDVAAGRATVRRWLGLGLSREEIIAQVRARTAKLVGKDPPDPPFALAAFDVSMEQLAAAKARAPKAPPKLSPEEVVERRIGYAQGWLEKHGDLPEWLRTAEVAAALLDRGLATEDQLRRIMPLDLLPRRKA